MLLCHADLAVLFEGAHPAGLRAHAPVALYRWSTRLVRGSSKKEKEEGGGREGRKTGTRGQQVLTLMSGTFTSSSLRSHSTKY